LGEKSISLAEAAERIGVSVERLRVLCKARRVKGARLVGRVWLLPVTFSAVDISPGKRGPKMGR